MIDRLYIAPVKRANDVRPYDGMLRGFDIGNQIGAVRRTVGDDGPYEWN